MKRLSLQLILLACIIPFYTVFAQQADWSLGNNASTAKHACRFVYPQGSAEIRSGLGNNAEVLSQLDSFIRSAITNSGMHIQRIFLSAYSSIEGSYAANERLAYNRVESFRDYLHIRYPELSRYPVDIVWVAEDWGELARLVRMSDINEREEILEIIRKVPNFDEREELLVKLNGGRAYMELQQTTLPQLRRVEIKIEYTTSPVSSPSVVETVQPVTVPVEEPVVTPVKRESMSNQDIDEWLGIGSAKRVTSDTSSSHKKEDTNKVVSQPVAPKETDYRFAIKTNLLSWIGVQPDFDYTTPVANVALEYYITPNWSVELSAAYSYWRYNHNQEFQGISGYKLEPRYRFYFPCEWFEIYLGLYGRVGDYDLRKTQNTNEGTTQAPNPKFSTLNKTGGYWDIGLSAGVQFNLPYNLAIGVGASVGYVKTNAVIYTQDNQYNWFKSREPHNKIRVTDINLSLIYRFR